VSGETLLYYGRVLRPNGNTIVVERDAHGKGKHPWQAPARVSASATVAGWTAWKDFPALWQTLSVIAGVVCAALPIIDVPRHIETRGEVHEGRLAFGEL
jgi:hypothetical protein